MALHPWASIIGSAVVAIACYFLKYGSGVAFFVCMSCGILMWHDETNLQNAAARAEHA
jgi:hypothetical protein